MPLLRIQTDATIFAEKEGALLSELSQIVAKTIGKPEQYVMVTLEKCAVRMSGRDGGAAFVDIRSIGGLMADVRRRLSADICALLGEQLKIAPARVYLNFTDVEAANWGWNGSTFG